MNKKVLQKLQKIVIQDILGQQILNENEN